MSAYIKKAGLLQEHVQLPDSVVAHPGLKDVHARSTLRAAGYCFFLGPCQATGRQRLLQSDGFEGLTVDLCIAVLSRFTSGVYPVFSEQYKTAGVSEACAIVGECPHAS